MKKIISFFGSISSFLCFLLLIITTEQVLSRYFFDKSSMMLQELEWHFFAALFLLAAAKTAQEKGHVRVDIFYANFKKSTQKTIDTLGFFLFLSPMVCLLIYYGAEYSFESYKIKETSPNPGGLPYRFIIKSIIPIAFFLLWLEELRSLIINFTTKSSQTVTKKDAHISE